MTIKRIDFLNAPSGSVDSHQRFMLGVGLDPNALVSYTILTTPVINRLKLNPTTGNLDLTGSGTNSGVTISTDGTLSADSDSLVPTQKAVKTYVDTSILTAIPELTADPGSPTAQQAWVLKTITGSIAVGSPVGLLLSLTYANSVITELYQFSYYTKENTVIRATLS